MKTAICLLESTNPYSQGRVIDELEVPKLNKERPDDYDKRVWRHKMWATEDEHVYIPGIQFCNSLKEAAKYANEQIKGKGKATYTKHFEAGVMVLGRVVLPDKIDDVRAERLYVPSDGKRGSGSRVWKLFPLIPKWVGTVTYNILDDEITEDIFSRVLTISGTLIGIGRFRPRNWGYYGTFKANEILWTVDD
jgi:hypothetical protein